MGKSMTVVKVHLGDGVLYYKPPTRVMDILKGHPNYFVVSISNGRRSILSSDVKLQPWGNYYLIPPDDFFSEDSHIPAEHDLCGSDKMYRVVGNYIASTRSVIAMLTPRPKHHSKATPKTKSSVVDSDWGANQQSARKRSLAKNGNRAEAPELVSTSLALESDYASASTAVLMLSGRSSLSDYEPANLRSQTSCLTGCGIPQFIPFGHGMVAKFKETRAWSADCGNSLTAKTGSDSGQESKFSCCPGWARANSLTNEGRGGIVAEDQVSKQKWLEDMIRGADNQFKRDQLRPSQTMPTTLQRACHPAPCHWPLKSLQSNEITVDR